MARDKVPTISNHLSLVAIPLTTTRQSIGQRRSTPPQSTTNQRPTSIASSEILKTKLRSRSKSGCEVSLTESTFREPILRNHPPFTTRPTKTTLLAQSEKWTFHRWTSKKLTALTLITIPTLTKSLLKRLSLTLQDRILSIAQPSNTQISLCCLREIWNYPSWLK